MSAEIKVLCANIQAGATTRSHLDYLVKGWNVWLPFGKADNLAMIARHAGEHDLVGLQESDGGSLRSGFACQATLIGSLSGLPHATRQINREIGPIIASGNALLGRFCPIDVHSVALPGKIPGRGVLVARYAMVNGEVITVIVAHLSLSAVARQPQVKKIAELLGAAEHPILMGDLNCPVDAPEMQYLFNATRLRRPQQTPATYPAWSPSRAIDHIWVGGGIECHSVQPLAVGGSDHLALSARVSLPSSLVPFQD